MPMLERPPPPPDTDPRLNRQHYEATKIPPSIHEGAPYPGCTQEELRSLDHAHEPEWHKVWKKKFRCMDIRQAVADLVARLRSPPSESQLAAIKRLKSEWNKETWTPDLAIKCFADLDRAYFFGQLLGRVRLRWKGSSRELNRMLGPTYKNTFGVTMREEARTIVPCARIILNAELIFLGSIWRHSRKRETFATLLHEMVHAFLTVYCGECHDKDEDMRGLDGAHGRSFQTCAWELTRRTESDLGYAVDWNEKHDRTGHGRPKRR
ncbi:hypothetical protein MMC17_002509 [Xylographa soralifera]|nr:hypothetical protein [Xylographa soralifera]